MQITNPAERLTEEFGWELEKRYGQEEFKAPDIRVPAFAERHANVCDLIVQLLWPDLYDTNPADPDRHTSATARLLARLFFIAAGIEPDSP